MSEEKMDDQLRDLYGKWLSEIENIAPEFINTDKYSNPYYISVPNGWCSSAVRILIVGKEGYGDWGMGRSVGVKAEKIQKIQAFNWGMLRNNLGYDINYDLYHEDLNERYRSPFWNRMRGLSQYGTCAWTNLDMIHHLWRGKGRNKCPLNDEERKKIHSVDTKILKEEIKILKPTLVIFFGWYKDSVQKELPELFNALNDLGDTSSWDKDHLAHIELDYVHYIMTYHPGWGYRHKGYEQNVRDYVADEIMKLSN